MTEKKAGEVLNHQLACEKEDDCVNGGYCEECQHNISDEDWIAALNVAISALEKQEVDKCCETCKYEHLDLDEYPCCDCIRAKDHYIPYTEEES